MTLERLSRDTCDRLRKDIFVKVQTGFAWQGPPGQQELVVFPEREGLKELGGKWEREELWDLQEDRESKASREILALKESREKKVTNKIILIIKIMTKLQVIFAKKKYIEKKCVQILMQ